MSELNSASRLLALLPAIYREDPFLGQYLWAFERVLLLGFENDAGSETFEGLEQTINRIPKLLDPKTTDPEFLPWLSTWMAFTLRADLDETSQRDFLAKVISLYRQRGTKGNLEKLLAIFTAGVPEVTEDPGTTHAFHVTISLKRASTDDQLRQVAIARALIEIEKPAHTVYVLVPAFPSMKVGVFSTVGKDTLLGDGQEHDDAQRVALRA